MNFQEPFRISDINYDKIVYSKIRNSNSKKIILTKYSDGNKLKNLVFQTPTMLSLGKPVKHSGYYELEVALTGKEKGKVDRFINFVLGLEKKIINDAQYYASSWFDTSHEKVVNYQKVIRESDEYSNGTFKIKIINTDDFETLLQLNNNKRINAENIPQDSWVKMLLEIYAVWVNSNNDFGIFIRPILISFTQREKIQYNYKFFDDSENEDEFEIPDSDYNTSNIFLMTKPSENTNESSTQLDIGELVKHITEELDSETEDSIKNDFQLNSDLLDITLGNKFSDNSTSSDSI